MDFHEHFHIGKPPYIRAGQRRFQIGGYSFGQGAVTVSREQFHGAWRPPTEQNTLSADIYGVDRLES